MTVKLLKLYNPDLRSGEPLEASHNSKSISKDNVETELRMDKVRINFLINCILYKNDIINYVKELNKYYFEFENIVDNYNCGIIDKADIKNYIRDNQDMYRIAYFKLNMDHFDIEKC